MKKIVFLINTLGMGGAERVLVDIVNNLDPKKFDITIKTIYNDYFFADQLNKNIKLESFYKRKKNKLIEKIFNKIIYLKLLNLSPKKLYKKIIKSKYDIEVAFLEGLPTKIMSGSTSSAKKIAWVHTSIDKNQESDIFFKSIDEQFDVYSKFNEIYCVSKQVKESFINKFKSDKNLYVVYNIINSNKILSKAKEKIDDLEFSECVNIINVGRLTIQKAHIRLLEAYSEFLEKTKILTHLYILGDGPEKEKIENKIIELKLQKYVTLTGNKDNPYKYMKNADLYICASSVEGYALVIMEALLLDLPVLTTDCGTIMNEIKNNDKYGIIVNNDRLGILNGLLKMIKPDKIKSYKNNIINDYLNVDEIKNIEMQLLK